MTEYFILFLIFIICYLIGSIPFGLILTKLFDNNDLRNFGSGNIGATNVLRTGNKTLALLTLILDLSKSFIPLFIFFKLYPHPIINDFFDFMIVDKIFLILVFGYFHHIMAFIISYFQAFRFNHISLNISPTTSLIILLICFKSLSSRASLTTE